MSRKPKLKHDDINTINAEQISSIVPNTFLGKRHIIRVEPKHLKPHLNWTNNMVKQIVIWANFVPRETKWMEGAKIRREDEKLKAFPLKLEGLKLGS